VSGVVYYAFSIEGYEALSGRMIENVKLGFGCKRPWPNGGRYIEATGQQGTFRNLCSRIILLLLSSLLLVGYATILTTEEVFSMWSAPCPVLSNNCKHVYNMCFLWCPCRSFVGDSEGRLQL
jgi:hypothetical protein